MVRMKYLVTVMGLVLSVSMGMADGKCEGKEGKHEKKEHQCARQALKFGGYVQPRWQATIGDSTLDHSFRIRRAYLGIGGSINDWFSYKVLATFPGASVSLYDAYIDVKPLKYVGIRVGQFLTPFGYEKQRSSSVILFPERSFASGHPAFPIMDRDIGVMAYTGFKFFAMKVGLFNGTGRNVLDDNGAKDVYANLTLTPLEFLHVGGSYSTGTAAISDTLELNWNRWGAELALTPWNLWLAAEFMGGADDDVTLSTYYAEAGWMFVLPCEWMYGIQPAVRYEFADPNTSTDDDSENIVTAGINFHFLPKHQAKLALCYRMIAEETAEVDNDQIIAQLQLKFP